MQTSERYFERSNVGGEKQAKENYTQMARRFTREISPAKCRGGSPDLNASAKVYRNNERDNDPLKYSPRSAVSAVLSKGKLMRGTELH